MCEGRLNIPCAGLENERRETVGRVRCFVVFCSWGARDGKEMRLFGWDVGNLAVEGVEDAIDAELVHVGIQDILRIVMVGQSSRMARSRHCGREEGWEPLLKTRGVLARCVAA